MSTGGPSVPGVAPGAGSDGPPGVRPTEARETEMEAWWGVRVECHRAARAMSNPSLSMAASSEADSTKWGGHLNILGAEHALVLRISYLNS